MVVVVLSFRSTEMCRCNSRNAFASAFDFFVVDCHLIKLNASNASQWVLSFAFISLHLSLSLSLSFPYFSPTYDMKLKLSKVYVLICADRMFQSLESEIELDAFRNNNQSTTDSSLGLNQLAFSGFVCLCKILSSCLIIVLIRFLATQPINSTRISWKSLFHNNWYSSFSSWDWNH